MSINIFTKAANVQETAEKSPVEVPLDMWTRVHKTLVLVYISEEANDICKGRALRFVSSLNQPDTIKADIMTAADGTIYAGLNFKGKTDKGPHGNTLKKLKKLYVQVIEVKYGA